MPINGLNTWEELTPGSKELFQLDALSKEMDKNICIGLGWNKELTPRESSSWNCGGRERARPLSPARKVSPETKANQESRCVAFFVQKEEWWSEFL